MDFYGQHSYDKESESEAMNVLVMKLIDVEQQIAEDEEEETEENVKEEDDAHFEAPLLYKELQPYVPPITLLSQPEQEDATTIPYYVQEELSSRELDELLDWVQDVFEDGEKDEEEEMEEKVKEAKDVPFVEPLLYKELKPYVFPITLSSQPKQEDVVTFPLKGEEVEKKETEEKVKVAEDVPFEALLLYKELNLMFLLLLFRAAYTKATGISGFLNLFHHTL
ncbi:hypothetical protein QYF36_006586 [Acer negundo]|nr:hypothetical protein QYF36_006586 [Acer negundo]